MKRRSFGSEDLTEELVSPISPTLPHRKRNWFFVLLSFSYFFSNSTQSLIAPFYPDIAKSRGFGETLIGLIFSLETLIAAFFSVLVGKKMNTFGIKRLFIIGITLSILGTILVGVLIHITNKELFLALSILAGLFQCLGITASTVVSFAYIPIFFPEDLTERVGMLEGLGSMGVIFGPLIGSATYHFYGYEAPFYTISIFLIIVLVIAIMVMPNDTNKKKIKNPENILKYFKNRKVLICIMSIILSSISLSFLDPILAFHLHDYGIKDNSKIALIFVIYDVSYVILCLTIQRITKKIGNKPVIFIGFFLLTIGSFLVGPDPRLFFLPRHISCVIIGLVLLGFGCAAVLLPNFEEIFETIKEIDPNLDTKAISAGASSFFDSFYTLGGCIGPLIGGSISENINFEAAAGIIGIMMLLGALVFAIHWRYIKKNSDVFPEGLLDEK